MNLKNNKGFVLTDVSVAVLIFIILIPTIMGIVYSLNSNKKLVEIKAEAINIAVNTLETAKGIELEELTTQKVLENLSQIYNTQLTIGSQDTADIMNDTASYRLQVQVQDYKGDNIVKTVKATVEYKTRGDIQKIEINTVVK